MLSNDDKLAQTLLQCGEESLDRASSCLFGMNTRACSTASLISQTSAARAGTITAACFLSRFTEKQAAHLDIAGSAWQSEPKRTGRPVGMLMQYLLTQKA